jgi:hypothetical protein
MNLIQKKTLPNKKFSKIDRGLKLTAITLKFTPHFT